MLSAPQSQLATPMFSDKTLACLKAPGGTDETELESTEGGLRCQQTGEVYPFLEGIPSLCQPLEGEGEDITTRVK